MPSIFAVDDKGNELIGHEAKRQWQLNPRNTVYAAKRLMGRSYKSDVVDTMQQGGGLLGEAGRPQRRGGRRRPPRSTRLQEVSARILNKIRDVASELPAACR